MTTDRDGYRRPHRRPRVLRVITRLSVSGPSTHVTLANQLLARRGWDTLLVHGRLQPDELAFELPVPGVATEYLPALARPIDPLADLRATAGLLDVVRRYRPDIIHTHHSKAGLLGRSVANLAGIPRVHTFHGHVFEGYFSGPVSAAIVAAERLMARASTRLIVLSPLQLEDLLARGIGRRDQFEVVPLGLDLHRFRPGDRAMARATLGLPADALIVVAVGRIVAIKRIDRLVRAFAIVHERHPDSRLYVIGDGTEREAAEAQAAAAGLRGAVTFCGWRSDIPDWYAAADFVALSSDSEGTPLAIIEAAAAGRPAVATAVGGVADVVADGVTGLLAPVEDEAAFADAVLRLASDPALRERMGAAAPAAASRFGAERLVDDLERIYWELLEGRRA